MAELLAGRTRRISRLAAISCTALLLGACASRDHVPPDCISPQRFVELYARLLATREAQYQARGEPASIPVDTLTTEEIAAVEDFGTRADLEPATWSRLLTDARDRARVLLEGQAKEDSSAGE